MKFAGSVALALTGLGVLFATGGQLDFLGNARESTQRPVIATTPESNPSPDTENKKPKYSFYDALKKRKTELERKTPLNHSAGTAGYSANNDTKRYVVQVGAFSKQSDAKSLQQTLSNLGYPSRIEQLGNKRFLTQAGPFVGRAKAEAAEKRLRQQKLDTLLKIVK